MTEKNFAKTILQQGILPVGYSRIVLPKLLIQTGQIVAGDPFSMPGVPLKKKINKGNFDIVLIYKDCKEWGQRVSFAVLIIQETKTIRWEPATNLYGTSQITIDSGLACLADVDTISCFKRILDSWKANTPQQNYYDSILKNEIRKKAFPGERISSFTIHSPFNDERNMAIFECGMGDGVYNIYWGLDENSQPASLIFDFDIDNW